MANDLDRYSRVRALWPDHLGLARGKYLPADPDRMASGKGSGHVVSTFGLGYDRSLVDAPGAHLMEGLGDMTSSFDPADVRQSWTDEQTAVVVCDLQFRGAPLAISPRAALRRAIDDWAALGYSAKVGIELEGYLLERDDDGNWRRQAPAGSMVFGTGPASDPAGLTDAVWWAAARSGIVFDGMSAEFDAGQHEFSLRYTDALRAADDAFLCRLLVRELASARGLDFTFLGQPFEEISGSGLHVNFSILDQEGRNVLTDPASPDGLSGLAHHALAGLCTHHRALVGIGAPTVNAYRRLKPGHLAGYWGNWGHDHRLATNRVPTPRGQATRLENRVGDGAANVHTMVAAVLQAARLGVLGGLQPPPPLTGDGMEDGGTDVRAAATLSEGLDDLEADEVFVAALGADLVANYLANKRSEWQTFAAAVAHPSAPQISEWELAHYGPYV